MNKYLNKIQQRSTLGGDIDRFYMAYVALNMLPWDHSRQISAIGPEN